MQKISISRTIPYIIGILLLIVLFFQCNNTENLQLANEKLKDKDFQNSILSEKYVAKYNAVNDTVILLKEKLKKLNIKNTVSENKLYAFQKKTTTIIKYVENIENCNDTIKKVVVESNKKDSLCNEVIADKNKEIATANEVIVKQEIKKQALISVNNLCFESKKELNQIIINDKKIITKEKNKKNFWKIATIAVAGFFVFSK